MTDAKTDATRETPLEDDFPFDIVSHLIQVPSSREYPLAIIDEQRDLYLSVKEYIPRNATGVSHQKTDPITIVVAGGLGFIKELYEPLFIEIASRAQRAAVNIGSIWIADMFNCGQSAVANRHNLGCDAAWIDHARDLWAIINHFRKRMKKPLIGIGHSMGCNQLLCLSSWHPTLFHSLAFVEPGIDPQFGRGTTVPWVSQILRQRDKFPTREEAESNLIVSQGARLRDPRAVARLKRYGVYQTETDPQVVWGPTSPKDQIAILVSRYNPGGIGLGPGGLEEVTLAQREVVPDSNPAAPTVGPFYRHELQLSWDLLKSMRPWVLYINGGKSPVFGDPGTREERARLTGTGAGGNGGVKLGAVRQVVIEEGGHNMPFDKYLTQVADHVAKWLVTESQRWENGPKRRRREWQSKSMDEKQRLGDAHVAAIHTELQKMKRKEKL